MDQAAGSKNTGSVHSRIFSSLLFFVPSVTTKRKPQIHIPNGISMGQVKRRV
jgi:hypothetical protein